MVPKAAIDRPLALDQFQVPAVCGASRQSANAGALGTNLTVGNCTTAAGGACTGLDGATQALKASAIERASGGTIAFTRLLWKEPLR